ncbi:MAG: tryptophan synthase subunit alpha [Spirochaetes bacterium]|nr:tryptophan synthase subunit alpha [Spirochaetota bacterium]
MSYNGFYLVGNYPDTETFIKAAKAGLEYFDFIEVGIPFSDPVADGPVLSTASHNALKMGVTTESVLHSCNILKEFLTKTGSNKKIYVMTYANKVFHCGIETTMKLFASNGVDGIILADVPFVESKTFVEASMQYNLDYIHFITPESTTKQIQDTCANAKGFIYTVSLRGTTGSSLVLSNEIIDILSLAKKYANVPVVLGFGIQNKNDIHKALEYADGFIMGTALVKKIEEGFDRYHQFLKDMFV